MYRDAYRHCRLELGVGGVYPDGPGVRSLDGGKDVVVVARVGPVTRAKRFHEQIQLPLIVFTPELNLDGLGSVPGRKLVVHILPVQHLAPRLLKKLYPSAWRAAVRRPRRPLRLLRQPPRRLPRLLLVERLNVHLQVRVYNADAVPLRPELVHPQPKGILASPRHHQHGPPRQGGEARAQVPLQQRAPVVGVVSRPRGA